MPDTTDKLDKFKQIVLAQAAAERDALEKEIAEEREKRITEAEARIKRETEAATLARANVISGESGREISRRVLDIKRTIASHREEMSKTVFAEVREKLIAFTKTDEYLPHLKKLYAEAVEALGNPYDSVVYLRPQDMDYARELNAVLPGRFVQFREGDFVLGGLIVDCESKLLRADQSYDTALNDLDGHFAELFGLSLAD